MKKLLLTTAIIMAMGTTAAFAHHPAADIVDPEIYAMIDENVSDVHAAMTFDDMGGDTIDVGGNVVSQIEDGSMGGIGENLEAVGAEMESREEMNAMADSEGRGPGFQK